MEFAQWQCVYRQEGLLPKVRQLQYASVMAILHEQKFKPPTGSERWKAEHFYQAAWAPAQIWASVKPVQSLREIKAAAVRAGMTV